MNYFLSLLSIDSLINAFGFSKKKKNKLKKKKERKKVPNTLLQLKVKSHAILKWLQGQCALKKKILIQGVDSEVRILQFKLKIYHRGCLICESQSSHL